MVVIDSIWDKKSSPESMSFLLAEMSDVHIVRKSATETIRESVTEDSRKSLSPVRNRSACAFNAARRIGRSFGSRILCSELTASSGVETSLMKDNELNRNDSNSVSLLENFSQNFRWSSSTT